jgi:class 3 adenylate cyclase
MIVAHARMAHRKMREECRVVTAVLADLVGSTSLSEQLDSGDYKPVLTRG